MLPGSRSHWRTRLVTSCSIFCATLTTINRGASATLRGGRTGLGTAPAAVFLAMIRMALNASYGQIIGQIGMLFAVILIIRVLPEGISSVLVRRGR